MVHASKKDLWILLAAWGPLPVLVVVAIHEVLTKGYDPGFWILGGLIIFYLAIMVFLAWPVWYEITATTLVIRSGVTRFEIPLSAIQKVSPTRNPLSAPAWSLDRLRIDYKKKEKDRFQLISPESKEDFFQDLVKAAEGLQLEGDGVVRVAPSGESDG